MQPSENAVNQIMHLLSAHDQTITVCIYHPSSSSDSWESGENGYVKPQSSAPRP